ncbi:MAG: hypothetical protein LRY71_15190 [Bacillaceae bacterium]|nr:hypothetical protein [Bacillaceae bacterium]
MTPNKTYLFLLFTIIRLVEEKTIRSNEQLEKYLLEKVNHYDQTLLHLLLSFLVEEKIVVKVNKKLLICYERCSEVIGGNTIPLEMRLAYYVCYANLTANFSSLFLAFIVSTYNDQQFCVSDLNTYLTKSKQAPKELVLANALNQLNSSGLVVKENETVYTISHETIDALSGVQISPFEILVPVFAHNRDLWTFMTWGDLGEWESMIHFTFSTQSFARALKNEQTLSQLIECLEKYFPKDTINDWKELFAEWVKKVTPIKKKTNMTFFPLADHLQKQLIKKQWSLWAIWAEEGIVIESINEVQFEKLLTDLGLQTSNEAIKKEKVEKQEINISNEIPSLNEGLSELDHIPKQWFHLTSYEERTRLRVVKQAILLQVFLQLEIGNEVDVLQPVKLEVANGHYTIVSKEGRKVSLDKVKRIAMIHPINIEEAKE